MDNWVQKLHLEPPDGWLNDPNGLIYFNGKYHVFFQYSPKTPRGESLRCWGHYSGERLTDMKFIGTAIKPDTPADRDGAYSGCAIENDGKMYIFYTGNVKEKGDFDYITAGRGANVIRIESHDGITMGGKKTVLKNSDYPEFCSCHVRDPKVWLDGNIFKMVLGSRTLEDVGCVLIYHSKDLENWEYKACITYDNFGYMWECPDYFEINERHFLSLSPQGLPCYDTRFQNLFQSGYFELKGDIENGFLLEFSEWDYGFDFYAPQSFEVPDGRRILIGWFGIGDDSYENPTIALGRQHCLTIPREITHGEHGLMQNPIREIFEKFHAPVRFENGGFSLPFMLYFKTESFELSFDNKLLLKYSPENKIFSMEFTDKKYGGGRTIRKAEISRLSDVRIIADMSSVEVFLNGGETVLSTRFYPEKPVIKLICNTGGEIYKFKGGDLNE